MIEISKESERLSAFAADLAKWGRARAYMRLSLAAFAKVALIYQRDPKMRRLDGYGRLASAMYREFRVKNKFYEVV